MDKKCYSCAAVDQCSVVCEYGSVLCTMKRMQSGQTKGELKRRTGERKDTASCPACGSLLREIGDERFCNNIFCIDRYKPI